jgi:hypothetical protein
MLLNVIDLPGLKFAEIIVLLGFAGQPITTKQVVATTKLTTIT